MTNEQIVQDLVAQFGENTVYGIIENYGLLNVQVQPETVVPLMHYLYQHPTFKFQFLTDLGGIHFPNAEGQELGVIYHLHSLENNVRLIIKTYVQILLYQRLQVCMPVRIGWSVKHLIFTE
jgi:NADH-quinone oxidoreductase subunit C